MLGVQPLLGRTFTKEEGEANGPKVVLLSEGLWREAFHANRNIVGQTVRVNNQARTVVGVMPASFRFPEGMGSDLRKGIWLPMQPTPLMLNERGYSFDYIVGKASARRHLRAGAGGARPHDAQHDRGKSQEAARRLQAACDSLPGDGHRQGASGLPRAGSRARHGPADRLRECREPDDRALPRPAAGVRRALGHGRAARTADPRHAGGRRPAFGARLRSSALRWPG